MCGCCAVVLARSVRHDMPRSQCPLLPANVLLVLLGCEKLQQLFLVNL